MCGCWLGVQHRCASVIPFFAIRCTFAFTFSSAHTGRGCTKLVGSGRGVWSYLDGGVSTAVVLAADCVISSFFCMRSVAFVLGVMCCLLCACNINSCCSEVLYSAAMACAGFRGSANKPALGSL